MSEPLEHPQTPVAEGEDIGPYQLTNPLEIGAVLRQLVLRGDNVTIYFAHGRQLMLSRLLAVDVPSASSCSTWVVTKKPTKRSSTPIAISLWARPTA